jgi:hypothetical protein
VGFAPVLPGVFASGPEDEEAAQRAASIASSGPKRHPEETNKEAVRRLWDEAWNELVYPDYFDHASLPETGGIRSARRTRSPTFRSPTFAPPFRT